MPLPFDLVLRGGTVVQPSVGTFLADVAVSDGKIAAIVEPGTDLASKQVEDVSGLHIFPGGVDPHAHIGAGGGLDEIEPDTGSAALGGVTTTFYILIDSGDYLATTPAYIEAINSKSRVDVSFHATLMTDGHITSLPALAERFGITSFKYYMSFRGDEGLYLGVEGTDDGIFYDVLNAVANIDGILAVHPENIEIVWRLRESLQHQGVDGLQAWDASRPAFVEAEALQRAAYLAVETGCRIYFVHISSRAALDALVSSRDMHPGHSLHAETCPHYLTHFASDPLGSLGKVNPPLRNRDDGEALWEAIASGVIDTLGSDHVGRRREKKTGSIWEASAGFPGLATTLPVLLSAGYHERGIPLHRIAEVNALAPARIFGLSSRKGDIRVGLDADLAVVDLQWERLPTAEVLGTWADYSLYETTPLKGWPRQTYVRGEMVQRDGTLVPGPNAGRYVPRSEL